MQQIDTVNDVHVELLADVINKNRGAFSVYLDMPSKGVDLSGIEITFEQTSDKFLCFACQNPSQLNQHLTQFNNIPESIKKVCKSVNFHDNVPSKHILLHEPTEVMSMGKSNVGVVNDVNTKGDNEGMFIPCMNVKSISANLFASVGKNPKKFTYGYSSEGELAFFNKAKRDLTHADIREYPEMDKAYGKAKNKKEFLEMLRAHILKFSTSIFNQYEQLCIGDHLISSNLETPIVSLFEFLGYEPEKTEGMPLTYKSHISNTWIIKRSFYEQIKQIIIALKSLLGKFSGIVAFGWVDGWSEGGKLEEDIELIIKIKTN